MLLFVGFLTSRQHASVSQGRICSDKFTCCHTEIEVADPTFYLTQSQYTDTGPNSASTDPITPGTWQGRHYYYCLCRHYYYYYYYYCEVAPLTSTPLWLHSTGLAPSDEGVAQASCSTMRWTTSPPPTSPTSSVSRHPQLTSSDRENDRCRPCAQLSWSSLMVKSGWWWGQLVDPASPRQPHL